MAIPDRNGCLASSYNCKHIGYRVCQCVHSPSCITKSFCPPWDLSSMIKMVLLHIICQIRLCPHWGVCPTLSTSCCVWNATAPNLKIQPLQSFRGFCCPCPIHTPHICPVSPLPTVLPRDTKWHRQDCEGIKMFSPTPEGVYLNIIFLRPASQHPLAK